MLRRHLGMPVSAALLLTFATVHYARCYVVLTLPWIDIGKYALGDERMPFQGRMLLMWPTRWAMESPWLQRIAVGHFGALQSPAYAFEFGLTFICVFFTGWLLSRFYRLAQQNAGESDTRWTWLPWALLLVFCFVQYILHSEQNLRFPYDHLSLALMTLSIYWIYKRNVLALCLLFPIATLNREITMLLIPLFLMDACFDLSGSFDWKRCLRWKVAMPVAWMSAVWLCDYAYVHWRFRNNPTEFMQRVPRNLYYLAHFQFWPQLLSAGSFLFPVLWLCRRQIRDSRLRAYLLIIPLWIVCMFIYGLLIETRIYGEINGLEALLTALMLQAAMQHGKRDTLAS